MVEAVTDELIGLLAGILLGIGLGCSTTTEMVSDQRLDAARHESSVGETETSRVREVGVVRQEGPSAFVLEEFERWLAPSLPSESFSPRASQATSPMPVLTRRVTVTRGPAQTERRETDSIISQVEVASSVKTREVGSMEVDQTVKKTTGAPPWMVGVGVLALLIVVAIALYSWTRRPV